MTKDKRYTTVKNLINSGFIKTFREIFDTIPKSIVYSDLGMNNARFKNLMFNVEEFVLNDIFRIAELIEVDREIMLNLVYKQYLEDNRRKK